MLGMAEDIAGAVSNVAELGQEATPRSVFDWIEQFPSQKFTEIYDQLNAAGVSAEDFRDNMFDLNDVMALVEAGIPPDVISSAELTADAQKYLAEQTTAANEAAGEQVDAMAENVEAQAETEAAVQATVERLQEQAEAHRDAAAASDEQQDAMRSANDVFYANQKAVRDARDAVDRYEETLADNESTLDDQAEALDDVAQSADTVAQSQVDVARQTAESEGATLSNTQALDIQNQSLLTQAGELQGPMRQALVDHIARLNGIPPEVVSDILALLDQAGIDNAETALTGVSRTREATVAADADQGALAQTEAELEWLTRNREVLVTIRRIFHDVLSSVPFAGNVTGSSASTSSAAAGGDTYNLNLPRGTRTDDVIRSLDRHARRNGRRAYAFR
jgi:hypothetical protein